MTFFILSGQLPVEAQIHKRRLSLYENIVRMDCVERDLAYRQLALKDSASKSWVVSLQEILYGLPNAQEVLDSPPEKLNWKVKVKRSVNEHWRKVIIKEAEQMSTLEFLNISSYTPGKVHPMWTNCKYNANSLLKAFAQVTHIYLLQSVRARSNQYQVSRLCPLCQESDETTKLQSSLWCIETNKTIILLLAVPRRLFRFGSLVILDVVCRYLSLFLLYINIKIGKNRC